MGDDSDIFVKKKRLGLGKSVGKLSNSFQDDGSLAEGSQTLRNVFPGDNFDSSIVSPKRQRRTHRKLHTADFVAQDSIEGDPTPSVPIDSSAETVEKTSLSRDGNTPKAPTSATREQWMTEMPCDFPLLGSLKARKFDRNMGGKTVPERVPDPEEIERATLSASFTEEYNRVNRPVSLVNLYRAQLKPGCSQRSEGSFGVEKDAPDASADKTTALQDRQSPASGESEMFRRPEGDRLKGDPDSRFNWSRDIQSTASRPGQKTLARLEQRFGSLGDRFGSPSSEKKQRFL